MLGWVLDYIPPVNQVPQRVESSPIHYRGTGTCIQLFPDHLEQCITVITEMKKHLFSPLDYPHVHSCIVNSLAASPSLSGQSSGRAAKPRAEGGEGLANIALDHVSLECQLHVPVNR